MKPYFHNASTRTHNVIIQSFLYIVAMKDFRKVTIADILDEAGISKGTFYKHFQDKYDLALQTYQQFFDEFKKEVLLDNGLREPDKFVLFYNSHRFYYIGLMRIEDDILSLRQTFKENLGEFYISMYSRDTIEADFYANQILWMMDSLSRLNRNIRKEDVTSFLQTGEKISCRLKTAY